MPKPNSTLWFNEVTQTFSEGTQRSKEHSPGDINHDGNVFIWSLPRNVFTIQSEWIQSLVTFSPQKHVSVDAVIKWSQHVSATLAKCLPNKNFKITRGQFGNYALFTKMRYCANTVIADGDDIYFDMQPMPKGCKRTSDLQVVTYSPEHAFYHTEEIERFAFNNGLERVEPGYTDKYGWTVLGIVTKAVDAPLGFMLDTISTTAIPEPTLEQARHWFHELTDLIELCYYP